MLVAQTFEECLGIEGRLAASAAVRASASADDGSGTGAGADADAGTDADFGPDAAANPAAIPVPEPMAGLLPGGLQRGEAAALATHHRDRHPDYLALALLAEALNAGLWCAVVGVPDLGLAALAEMLGPAASPRQAALDRLLLVPEPGEHWAKVLAVLADAVDLLLVRPPSPVSTQAADSVDARLRPNRPRRPADGEPVHEAALLVLGGWPSAQLSLRVTRADWTGLDGLGPTVGTGRLTGCRATVVAQGRATAGRPRAARLWLPDANGSVRTLSDDPRSPRPGGGVSADE